MLEDFLPLEEKMQVLKMKQKNKEALSRAIGILEGLYWLSEENTRAGLTTVYDILDAIMEDESITEEEQKFLDRLDRIEHYQLIN